MDLGCSGVYAALPTSHPRPSSSSPRAPKPTGKIHFCREAQSMSLKKGLKYLAIVLVVVLVVAVSSAAIYRSLAQWKIARSRAIHSPDGIDSVQRVSIGGIDQWIEVRGESVKNPILLFIHGGP